MRQKILYISLIATALLCILFCLSQISFSSMFTSVLAFPFEQIASLLRFLSLSGRFLNAIALMLYVGICLIPIWFILWIKNRRTLHIEDWLLVLLSGLLFMIIYLMINVEMMAQIFNVNMETLLIVQKSILGNVFWSVLVGYVVLHAIRLCFESSTEKLQDYLKIFLSFLAFLFVCAAFGMSFGETLNSFDALKAGNIGNESTLGMSYVFLTLRFLVNITPFMLNIATIFFALRLLHNMKVNRYSDETVISAEKLSLWCKKTLSIVVLTNIFFNVSQLLFAKNLRSINSSISIPIVSIFFVIAILIFARIIAENKQLKSDNDLFI